MTGNEKEIKGENKERNLLFETGISPSFGAVYLESRLDFCQSSLDRRESTFNASRFTTSFFLVDTAGVSLTL
jgi:hypothetical protein